jgi:homoserine O-acetyltransferase/O-succinyltransferase
MISNPGRKSYLMISLLSCLIVLSPAFSLAHRPGDPPHQLYPMGDLQLQSGEAIKDFAISYVTHGTLNEKKSNAILMTSSLVGNHHRLDYMIGPGKAFDPEKYFIICTDAIGNGLTTSPSNSQTQPRMSFPKFSIQDMVESQYRLVTEKFGIKRLVSVAGASMGGIQSIQWAVSYPDMVDSVIAQTPSARCAPWSAGIYTAGINILKADAAWNNGNYTEQPEKGWRAWANVILALLANTPEGIKRICPTPQDAIAFLKTGEENWLKAKFDANDCIYQSTSIIEFDVGKTRGFNGDYIKALKSIKAKVLILTGPNDLLVVPEIKEDGKYIKDVRIAEIPSIFGHFAANAAYNPADVDFMNRISKELLDDATLFGKKLQ